MIPGNSIHIQPFISSYHSHLSPQSIDPHPLTYLLTFLQSTIIPLLPLRQIFRNLARHFHHTHHQLYFLTALDILHYDIFFPQIFTNSPPLRSHHHANTTFLCHRSYPTYLMSLFPYVSHDPYILPPSSPHVPYHSHYDLSSPVPNIPLYLFSSTTSLFIHIFSTSTS